MTISQATIVGIFEGTTQISSGTADNTFINIANNALMLSNRDFKTDYAISIGDVENIVVRMRKNWIYRIQFILKQPNSQSPLFEFVIKYKPGFIRNGVNVRDMGVDKR